MRSRPISSVTTHNDKSALKSSLNSEKCSLRPQLPEASLLHRSFYINSAGSLVTDWKSAHWDGYQWKLFTACTGTCTVSHPSGLFPWQPLSLPSTCERSQPSEKSPRGSKCHWQGQRLQVGDDQNIVSTLKSSVFSREGEAQQNSPQPGLGWRSTDMFQLGKCSWGNKRWSADVNRIIVTDREVFKKKKGNRAFRLYKVAILPLALSRDI